MSERIMGYMRGSTLHQPWDIHAGFASGKIEYHLEITVVEPIPNTMLMPGPVFIEAGDNAGKFDLLEDWADKRQRFQKCIALVEENIALCGTIEEALVVLP